MTDPQATAQPIDGITTFAIELANAREEGRQQGLREAAEIARRDDYGVSSVGEDIAAAIEAKAGEK